MTCNFTFSHYAECLAAVRDHDIEIVHDLDYSPHNVLRMAEIERRLGIRTKYFIRLHARFYNALSLEHIQIFKALVSEYGHELGLHLEPGYYSPEQMTNAIKFEAQVLQFFTAEPIRYISLHSPTKTGKMNPETVPSDMRYYCFDSPYYTGKKYISDSGGRWREGCMCQHIGKHEKLIILTHPNWWFERSPAENY